MILDQDEKTIRQWINNASSKAVADLVQYDLQFNQAMPGLVTALGPTMVINLRSRIAKLEQDMVALEKRMPHEHKFVCTICKEEHTK